MYSGGAWTIRSDQSCSSLPRQTSCGSRSRLRRWYASWTGDLSSSRIRLSNSAVGMLRRLASLCVRASTSIVLFLLLLIHAPSRRLLLHELIDQCLETRVDLIDCGKLRERPPAEFSEIVHTRHPIGAHGVRLLLRVLAAIALHFDDQIERLLLFVIDLDDEIGDIAARRRAHQIRHFEAEVLVLHIGAHTRMRFHNAAEFGLPVAVADDPVDVAFARVGLPARLLR